MTIYPKLKSLLIDSGLTETESAVYVELLKKPAGTIWELKGVLQDAGCIRCHRTVKTPRDCEVFCEGCYLGEVY